MFGNGGIRPELEKFLGRNQLHMFFGGFARRNIVTVAQAKKLKKEELEDIMNSISMPPAARERLLDILGKEDPDKKKKPKAPKPKPKPVVKTNKPAPSSLPGGSKAEVGDKTKTEASTYYHFKSTDKSEAAKYDAQVVQDPNKVAQVVSVEGGALWNTGATFEERDYTKAANDRWKEIMLDFNIPGSPVVITEFVNCNMDYSIILNRGKVKYIYDLSFKCKWKAKIEDSTVKGTLSIFDVVPDEDDEDWEFEVTVEGAGGNANTGKMLVTSAQTIFYDKLKSFLVEMRRRGPAPRASARQR